MNVRRVLIAADAARLVATCRRLVSKDEAGDAGRRTTVDGKS